MNTEAETGIMQPQAKRHQRLLAATRIGRKKWNGFSLRAFLSLYSTGKCLADELELPHSCGSTYVRVEVVWQSRLLTSKFTLFYPKPETILLCGMSGMLLWEKVGSFLTFLAK